MTSPHLSPTKLDGQRQSFVGRLVDAQKLSSAAREELFAKLMMPLTHDKKLFEQSYQGIISRIMQSIHTMQ